MIMVMVVQLKRTMQPKRITNRRRQRLHTELANPMMPHKRKQRSRSIFKFFGFFFVRYSEEEIFFLIFLNSN